MKCIISNVTRHNGETRTDDHYPQRIGSTVELVGLPLCGKNYPMFYVLDNEGKPKEGTLVTSPVISVRECNGEIRIKTRNSIFVLREVNDDTND